MILRLECSACGQPIEFLDEAVGQSVACPGCAATVTLQTPAKPPGGFRPAPVAAAPTIPKVAAPAPNLEAVVDDWGDQLFGAMIALAILTWLAAVILIAAAADGSCSWWLVVSVALAGVGFLVQGFFAKMICRCVAEGLRLLRRTAEAKR